MKIFDIKLALSKPTKEKGAPGKLALFFGVNIVFFLAYFGFSFIMAILDGNDGSGSGLAAAMALPMMCLIIIGAILLWFFNLWHQYEYTAAAIESRDTNALWEQPVGDSFKKAGKLGLLTLIYNIPMGILYFCGIMFAYVALFGSVLGGAGLTAAAYDNAYDAGYGAADTSAALGIVSAMGAGIVIYCCIIIVLAVLQMLYNTFVVTPAYLRLVETNTFGRGFDLGKNWNFAKQHSGEFTKLMLIQIGIGLIAFAFYMVSYLLSFILIGIPLMIIFVIAMLYWGSLASHVFTGNFYRSLKQR